MAKRKVIATKEVSEATDWKYEFKDLAAYDENGGKHTSMK